MELEEMAEPDWSAEEFAERYDECGSERSDWASDYPIWTDDDPDWVDAYEL